MNQSQRVFNEESSPVKGMKDLVQKEINSALRETSDLKIEKEMKEIDFKSPLCNIVIFYRIQVTTDYTSSPASQIPKISEIFGQLQVYLDNLSTKFAEVKEKHQADFLLAYRNHMSKVRRELQELKQRSEDQERQLKQNDRVASIEKQLSWFREESIKLYQKLELKSKQNYELKFKLEEVEKERSFLENQVKSLLKRNRLLEVYLFQKDAEKQEQPIEPKEPVPDTLFYTNPLPINYDRIQSKLKQMTNQTVNQTHLSAITTLIHDYGTDRESLTRELTNYVQLVEASRENTFKHLNQRVHSLLKQSTKSNMIRSDLENFFLECVETVRRQVMKRRAPQQRETSAVLLGSGLHDYTVFRAEDKQHILELLLTHEKLLVYLYQKIFPTHFSSYVQSFTTALGGNNTTEQGVEAITTSFQGEQFQLAPVRSHSGVPRQAKNIRKTSVQTSDKLQVKKGKLIFKQ